MQKRIKSITNHAVALLIAAILGVSGCSFPGVYKINVQQGNIVTEDMLAKLRVGMTRKQVHFVLGNPVVENLFDDQQENFIYSYQKAGGDTLQQHVTIFYENGLYSGYEADLLEEHPAY